MITAFQIKRTPALGPLCGTSVGRNSLLVAALCALFAAALSLHAQSSNVTNAAPTPAELKLIGGGGVSARALANQANNPAAPLTTVQFRDVVAPTVPGFDTPANVLQIDPVLPIFPSRLLPFTQLLKLTLQVPTTPGPGSATGFGDIDLFDLVTVKQSWGMWGFGPSLVFPTASSEQLGQGKWQAGPSIALIYTGIHNLTAGAVLQNPISFAGQSDRHSVSALTITPTLTYNLPHGWFAGYSDFDWTFDWKNDGAATIPVGLQAGRIFKLGKVPVSLSLEGAWNAVRPDNTSTPNWLIGVEFTVIFPTARKHGE
jgi:hypothetical protein